MNSEYAQQALDSGRALGAAIALTFISMAAFLVLPLYAGAAAEALSLSAAQIGVLSSLVGGGSAVSSLLMMLLVRRVNWRRAARLTLGLMLLAMSLSLVIHEVWQFMALQCLAGLGAGATYSLALTALSDRSKPDQAFGYSVAAQVAFQVVGMLAIPSLVSWGGLGSLLGMFILLELGGLALVPLLPEGGRAHEEPAAGGWLFGWPTMLALGGCFFFFFNVGAVWTYVERMAVLAGFSASQIGQGLALGVATGIPGALLASWCGDRFGRLVPIALTSGGIVLAVTLLGPGMQWAGFVGAVVVYNLCWNFSLPYQYAAVNEVDQTGRGVAAAPALHGFGAAAGPGLVAMYVTESDLTAVNWAAGSAVLASLLLFALALYLAHRAANRYPVHGQAG